MLREYWTYKWHVTTITSIGWLPIWTCSSAVLLGGLCSIDQDKQCSSSNWPVSCTRWRGLKADIHPLSLPLSLSPMALLCINLGDCNISTLHRIIDDRHRHRAIESTLAWTLPAFWCCSDLTTARSTALFDAHFNELNFIRGLLFAFFLLFLPQSPPPSSSSYYTVINECEPTRKSFHILVRPERRTNERTISFVKSTVQSNAPTIVECVCVCVSCDDDRQLILYYSIMRQ